MQTDEKLLSSAQQTFYGGMNSVSKDNPVSNFPADHTSSVNKEEKSMISTTKTTEAVVVAAAAATTTTSTSIIYTTAKKKKRADMLRYNGSAFPSDFFKDSAAKVIPDTSQLSLEHAATTNNINNKTPSLPIDTFESPQKKKSQPIYTPSKSSSPNEFLQFSDHPIQSSSSQPLCPCKQRPSSSLPPRACPNCYADSTPTKESSPNIAPHKNLKKEQANQIEQSAQPPAQPAKITQCHAQSLASQHGENSRPTPRTLESKEKVCLLQQESLHITTKQGRESYQFPRDANYAFPSETPKFNEQQRMVANSSESDQSPQKSDFRLNPSKITQNRCSFSFTFAEKLSSSTQPSQVHSSSKSQHQSEQSQRLSSRQLPPPSQHDLPTDDLDTTFMISEASTQAEHSILSQQHLPHHLLCVKQDPINLQLKNQTTASSTIPHHQHQQPPVYLPKQSKSSAKASTLQVNRSSPSLIGRSSTITTTTTTSDHKNQQQQSTSSQAQLIEQKENVRFVQANEVDDFAQGTTQTEKHSIIAATAGLFRIGSISKFDLIPLLRGQAKFESNKSADHTADFLETQPTSAAGVVQAAPLPCLRATAAAATTLEAASIRQHLQFYRQRSEKRTTTTESSINRAPIAAASTVATEHSDSTDPKSTISEFKLSQVLPDETKCMPLMKSWTSQPYQLVIPQSNSSSNPLDIGLSSAPSAAELFFNSNEFDQLARLRSFIASEKGDRKTAIATEKSESDSKKRTQSSITQQRYHYQQVYSIGKPTSIPKGGSFCHATASAASGIASGAADSFCNASDSFAQAECSFGGAGSNSTSFGQTHNLSHMSSQAHAFIQSHILQASNTNSSSFARRGISAGPSLKSFHTAEEPADIIIPIATSSAGAPSQALHEKEIFKQLSVSSARRMQKVRSLPKIRSATKFDTKTTIEPLAIINTSSPQISQQNENKRVRLIKIYRIPATSIDAAQSESAGIQSIRSARDLSVHSRHASNGARNIRTIASARGGDSFKRDMIDERKPLTTAAVQTSQAIIGALSTQSSEKTLFRERSLAATKNTFNALQQNQPHQQRRNSKDQLNRIVVTESNEESTPSSRITPSANSSSSTSKITRVHSAQKPQNLSTMPSILAKITFQKKPPTQALKLSSKDASDPCEILRSRNVK